MRKHIIIFSLISSVFFIIIFIFFTSVNDNDYKNYEKTINKKNKLEASSNIIEKTYQKRVDVEKNIWIPKKNDRTVIKMTSPFSELYLGNRKNKIELIEKLKDIKCYVQENTNDNSQVKLFTSEEGIYFFPKHQFSSDKIKIYFFSLKQNEPFNDIPLSRAFFNADAKDFSFLISQNQYYMNAKSFKANLHSSKEL